MVNFGNAKLLNACPIAVERLTCQTHFKSVKCLNWRDIVIPTPSVNNKIHHRPPFYFDQGRADPNVCLRNPRITTPRKIESSGRWTCTPMADVKHMPSMWVIINTGGTSLKLLNAAQCQTA